MALSLKRSPKAAKSVVGLDLDPAHLAAAEVHVNGGISVTRGAVQRLSPGVLRDGEVSDGPALTSALKELWGDSDLPKTVRLGIANQRVVVRTLDMPALTDEKALEAAVRVEAPDHIPMPMNEAVLDFQSLGTVDTPAGLRTRVVVVAIRREMVDRYLEAVRAAGLKVEGVDLSAFALVRSMYRRASDDDGGMLYINVAGLTNVAVTSADDCLFTRAATGGLETMVQSLADRRGLTAEHSAQWLGHVGLDEPLESVEGDPEIVGAARVVLEEGVHQLADTVRNSLNFYRMQQNAVAVERAIMTGPAVAIPGLAAHLGAELGMSVEARTVAQDGDVADASRLAVAAGLAVSSL
ncbi:MAG: type pilus assembly protein PilM [Solirubrobacteraceae bacterium]|jgi:type IV pilus assembly protein PilM|nr:type pilus assembly protein PilM [Solirubrobacteraceae bacterium]